MNSDPVILERYGRRAELVLNRPDNKNAVTGPLVQLLCKYLMDLSEDPDVGAIIIRGADGCFCAGLDLKQFSADPPPSWRPEFQGYWVDLHTAIYECPKPTIAAVERFAIAAGSGLAFACDMLVMGDGAFIHVLEVERGMTAPINIAWLQLKLGAALAAELSLAAQRYYGPDAVRKGLAMSSVPDAEVLDTSRSLADRMASFPQEAMADTKKILHKLSGISDIRQYLTEAVKGK
jgi:enoyl-CoA hydratase/carnithine racemase